MFGASGMFSGGGLGNMFGGMGGDGDDNSFHFTSTSGGMPGGMPGARSRRQPPTRSQTQFASSPRYQPEEQEKQEITRPLKLSLEDLFHGTVKHLKIGRRLVDGTTEDKVLEINVLPGWKDGTKIRFPKAGNEVPPYGDAQDLVFVVEAKPHETFSREGNDLTCSVKLPLVEALTGASGKKVITLLDGRKLQIAPPFGVVKPGQETTIPGEGMPIRKEGSVKKRGDLIVKWDITFPSTLTSTQKELVRKALTPV